MSYLVVTPELATVAAGELATIQTSLSAAANAAATPTTGLVAAAADDVSAAVAQLFGVFGQDFQAVNTRASAFHADFLQLLNGSATAYCRAETLGAASLAAPAAVGGAYQELFADTQANLRAFQTTWSADPAPFLRQVITNQQVYAQTIAGQAEHTLANLPTVVRNLPADIQSAIRAITHFDPTPYIQQFITNQTAYANTVSTSLHNAGQSLSTGLQALPPTFRTALQDVQTGNFGGALSTLSSGFLDLAFTGFHTVVTPTVPIGVDVYPEGTLGDLFPILAIPGQEAQDLTNLMPAGSIPAQISQNFTHVVKTLTDTTIAVKVPNILPPTFKIDGTLGMPLALAYQAAGAPINAVTAVGDSASAFANAVQSGNAAAAFGTALDAPAVIANGFLNGQQVVQAPINIGSGLPTLQLNLPLNGLLVPQTPLTTTIDWGFPYHTRTYSVDGIQFGGLIPALYGASVELAHVIRPA